MGKIDALMEQWRGMSPIEWAEHPFGWIGDTGQSITLAEWQRVILSQYWQRRHDVSTLFISTTKKAGKTLLNSLVTCYRWLTIPSVHFVVGNDKDQSAELQINMIGAMIKRHPVLSRFVRVNRSELIFEPTGSRIVSLPMDASGAAGANFATVSFTEVWGFTYEENQRLYDELTPIPAASAYDCLRIVDSYAGFDGESELLQGVWDRGKSGERVNDQWPVYLVGQQLSYIHQGEDAQRRCWRFGESGRDGYYSEQAATLRPNAYRRLHLNEWVSAESAFILPGQWDALIDPDYRCPTEGDLVVGIDLAVKHDTSAVVSVVTSANDGSVLGLGPYRIFRPRPTVDLQAIEEYLIELFGKYWIASAVADPYQAALLMQRMLGQGLTIDEYPQTVGRMTEAGNTLFDLIRQRRLVVYPGTDDLRKHVLACTAKETERGIRLIKTTAGRKIDAAIALAMAATVGSELFQRWAGPWITLL